MNIQSTFSCLLLALMEGDDIILNVDGKEEMSYNVVILQMPTIDN